MDRSLKEEFIVKWSSYFPDEPLPITFEFSSELRGVEKAGEHDGWRCFVCDLTRVRKGKDTAFGEGSISCRGGKRYCGYEQETPPDFRYFLSSGIAGKMEGERYKKTPELVDEWQGDLKILPSKGQYLIMKRWDHLTEEDSPVAVIFFARGEVLSGLFTLANYDRSDPFGVITPMGAGCSSIIHYPWHEAQADDPRAVLGMMDPSARPCIPLDTLTFAVPMKKFATMVRDMEECFLINPDWDKVRKKIEKSNALHAPGRV